MRGLSRILVLSAAVVAALAGGVLPAHAAVTLDDGHVDGAFVKYVSPNLQLWVGDHTSGSAVERAPADVILRAKPESESTVPASPNPTCLGTPQSPVWILPQVENTSLLWLGWSAASIGSGVVDGNQVTLRLKSVSPPGGVGTLCVYSKIGLSTTKIFDSSDGLPDSVAIPVGATGHRHVNWAFTASGTWTVVFEVTAAVGGVAKSSGDKTYTFSID
jgi:surface-anchored protein